MSEEQIQPAEETTEGAPEATETPTPSEEGAEPTAAAPETPPAAPYDWRKALDEAPADELRKHPKFAGILGSEKPRWQQEYEARKQADDEAKAAANLREQMRQKARQNPVAFADEWLGADEAKEQEERLQGLESKARQDIAAQVGAALHTVEEWKDVLADPEALAAFTAAPAGKKAEEVIPAAFSAATRLVGQKIGQKLFAKWKAEELTKEREAMRAEVSAELLQEGGRPDLTRADRAGRRGSWEDAPAGSKEFKEGWERWRAQAAMRRR